MPVAAISVSGSAGVSSKSSGEIWDELSRAIVHAAGNPAAMPARTSVSVCRAIIQVTPLGVAPSATRTPISEVRRATVKDISP